MTVAVVVVVLVEKLSKASASDNRLAEICVIHSHTSWGVHDSTLDKFTLDDDEDCDEDFRGEDKITPTLFDRTTVVVDVGTFGKIGWEFS